LVLLEPKDCNVEFECEAIVPLEPGQEDTIEIKFTAANMEGEHFYIWSLGCEDGTPFGSTLIAFEDSLRRILPESR